MGKRHVGVQVKINPPQIETSKKKRQLLADDMSTLRKSTIRVGVTGHRWNRIDPRHRLRLLRQLKAALARIGRREGRIHLVCGMAEGSDLLAALARPPGWRLEAVLPLPLSAWRAHLAEVGGPKDICAFNHLIRHAKVTVLRQKAGPDYAALARHIAEHSDLLVAVWNGEPGLPGGTGEVVTRCRARSVPVVILPPPK